MPDVARRPVATVPDEIELAFKEVRLAPEPLNVVAVIVAPVKLPDASRATIVEAPLEAVAVVRSLLKVPVEIELAFNDVMLAPEKAAVVEPVPPLAIGRVPVTLVCKFAYVVEVEPVPPEAIGRAEPRVNEVK